MITLDQIERWLRRRGIAACAECGELVSLLDHEGVEAGGQVVCEAHIASLPAAARPAAQAQVEAWRQAQSRSGPPGSGER